MQSNGLATFLLLIPVLTVPALAIFGIPQFAPVVASPLDEGPDRTKEPRLGDSARPPRDDLFGDDDFGAEPDDPSPPRRDTSLASNPNRRNRSRSQGKATESRWGDDLFEDADFPSRPNRKSAPDFETEPQPPSAERLSLKSNRQRRRDPVEPKDDGFVRVATAGDLDQKVIPAGFADEPLQEQGSGTRSRTKTESRNFKRREIGGEPLTWQNAVERLNALDIRSFRLEPGQQIGQFVFICSYTPPDNPRVSYRFEAEADEPLKAVEKVLEQIVERQQQR